MPVAFSASLIWSWINWNELAGCFELQPDLTTLCSIREHFPVFIICVQKMPHLKTNRYLLIFLDFENV